MSYQVLARKLRPGKFSDLVGQEHVVRALAHALDHDRLHHAYLFTGTRGVGKTTIGRILAKCLNCESGVSSTPCDECSSCIAVSENRFIDLIEVDAASRTGVDATRELLENAQYLPTQGRFKVYLIDEVHMLTTQSFNALLKTLEEPPEHVKFLLATTDPKKVPVTVLSRCLQFQLKKLSAERMQSYLQQILLAESITAEADALMLLAQAARGSMRDALSLTDQAIAFGAGALRADEVAEMLGSVGRSEIDALLSALADQDASRVLEITEELSAKGLDLETVLESLLNALHALAVESAIGRGTQSPFDGETLQLYYQIALTGFRDMPWSPDSRVGLEMTLLRMLAFSPDPPESASDPRTASSARTSTTRVKRNTQTARPEKVSQPGAASVGSGSSPVLIQNIPEVTSAQGTSAEAATAEAATAQAATERKTRPQKPVPQETARQETLPQEIARQETVLQETVPQETDSTRAWAELVSAMELTGVTRMIAEHSVRVDMPGNIVSLKLNPAHDTLLNERQVATLEAALAKSLGPACRLQIEIGASVLETPAQQEQRLQQQRQQAAEIKLQGDPNIQRLLSEFNGELVGVRSRDNPGRTS